MELLPAIDLLDGKAVRLYRGDYSRKTVYCENPLAVALYFKKCGAKFLHIVDLAGAKSGMPEQFPLIAEIIRESGLRVEVGGGIRSMQTAGDYINAGAYRIILGTSAVNDGHFLSECVRRFGGHTAVGVDIKNGRIAVKGWTELSRITAQQFLAELNTIGVGTVICTDISKDGALQGVDAGLYSELAKIFAGELIASGGVSTLADIQTLAKLNISGAILGKALYTGDIDLSEALNAAGGTDI